MGKTSAAWSGEQLGTRLIGWIDVLPLCRKLCQRWIIGLTLVGLAAVVVHQYATLKWKVLDWDLLLVSGFVMFVPCVYLAGQAPSRFRNCVTRLHDRGVLDLANGSVGALIDEFEGEADRWARIGAVIIGLSLFVAFVVVLWGDFWLPRALLGLAETALGYVAGGYLGRMAYYGQLRWRLRRRRVGVAVNPWHADRAGGLKPIGDFCFMQAMVIALPAAFFATWLLLIPIWPKDYQHWQGPYLALLPIAIVIELLAFVWPLWSFHTLMVEQKQRWRRKVDRLYQAHAASRKALLDPGASGRRRKLKETLDIAEGLYVAVERMPTWPVDLRLGLRFAVNNALIMLPLVSDLMRQELEWPSFLEVVWLVITQ